MDFTKMSAYLDSFYAHKNIPGVGCAVYHRNKPVYEHYTGFSDVENAVRFGPDTLFNLYSATKVITCVAALQLMEAGKYRLEDPLYEYIPQYRHMAVRHVQKDGGEDIREAQRPITIENLFTMSGGLSGSRDTPSVQKVVKETQGKAPTLEVIRAMAKDPLLFEPGTHFKYGVCHDVLGALIEVVSGKRFGAYLQENIFERVGMPDTSFCLPEEKKGRMAKLYIGFDAKANAAKDCGETFVVRVGTEYESGGGGLISCVPDYIKFAAALCNGGVAHSGARLLAPATIDSMRANRLTGDMVEDFRIFGGWSKEGYGYGLGVRTLVDRERNNALSENGEFGWDGARGCYVVIDPAAELALFYAQQEAGSRWYEWHGTVRNYAYASVWG